MSIEPRERGAGFEFVDDTVGGTIPRQFVPAVEKGIKEALEHGVFAGYPVVDVCARATDGKSHPVDSNETSFRIAGRQAFKDAFLKARPCLLEPIVDLVVEVPSTAMGDITGDLNSRRGRIAGLDSLGNLQVIKAQIPLREILDYSTQLRSMTAGEGSYHFTFSHYDVVPVEDRAGARRPLQAARRGIGGRIRAIVRARATRRPLSRTAFRRAGAACCVRRCVRGRISSPSCAAAAPRTPGGVAPGKTFRVTPSAGKGGSPFTLVQARADEQPEIPRRPPVRRDGGFRC